jgi:uncharacterized membrane protein (DUF4010 family)
MAPDHTSVMAIAAAALAGAAIGVERQWSGHATGPRARFGGVRTFTLLGGLAGVAGQLWAAHFELLAAALLAGATALVVAAYAAASRRDVEGTTEVAALVVLAAGTLAGLGRLALASSIVAVTALLLVEKTRLHGLVARLDDAEMRAAVRFGVMAVVVLPLLPTGPFGPLDGVRPRQLWGFVLLFSGLSFVGYVARRAVGSHRGYPLAGALGGLVSSTAVTWTFAHASRRPAAAGVALAIGALAACTMMFVRALVAVTILDAALGLALLPLTVPPLLVGAAGAMFGMIRVSRSAHAFEMPSNPLQVRGALQMAALFQFVLLAVHLLHARWGHLGLLASGAVLGFADVDALLVSMASGAAVVAPRATAAQALALGMLANTLLKLAVVVMFGRGRFRPLAAASLAGLAVASGGALALFASSATG